MSILERYTFRQLPRVLRIGQVWKNRKENYYVIIKQVHRKDKNVEVMDIHLDNRRQIGFTELAAGFRLLAASAE